MIFGRKSKGPKQPPSKEVDVDPAEAAAFDSHLSAPEIEKIQSTLESKLLEKEVEEIPTSEIENDQSELIPEYKVGKVLRQGPWMHPFPLIVGVSIIGLLVALFAANLQIN